MRTYNTYDIDWEGAHDAWKRSCMSRRQFQHGQLNGRGDACSQRRRRHVDRHRLHPMQSGAAPGHQNSVRQSLHLEVERYIYVNQKGERFVAEDARRDVIRDAVLALPEKYGFVIVDAEGFAANPSAAQRDAKRGLKTGDSFTAPTLAELAVQLKIDPKVLQKTVDAFNACVDKKSDAKFDRKPDMLTHKLLKGPWWAAYSAMAVHHTMGGVRIDTKARVIDLAGKVYAAGEVTGGIHGSNRVGGNAVLDIHVFGRIVGRSAASVA